MPVHTRIFSSSLCRPCFSPLSLQQTISNAKKQIKAEIDRKRAVIDEEAQNLSLEAELLEEGLGSDRTLRQRTGYVRRMPDCAPPTATAAVSRSPLPPPFLHRSDRAGTSRKKKKTGASTATDYRLSAQQLSLEVRPWWQSWRLTLVYCVSFSFSFTLSHSPHSPRHTPACFQDWEINDDVQLLTNEKRARKAGRGNQAPSGSSAGAADGGSKSPAYDYY